MKAFDDTAEFETRIHRFAEDPELENWEEQDRANEQPNTELHPMVNYLVFGIFMLMLAAYLLRFLHDSFTTFMVAISIGYFLMYFGVPYVMLRDREPEGACDRQFAAFLRKPFATNTGIISGLEATLQACLIPAAITACTIGICIIM